MPKVSHLPPSRHVSYFPPTQSAVRPKKAASPGFLVHGPTGALRPIATRPSLPQPPEPRAPAAVPSAIDVFECTNLSPPRRRQLCRHLRPMRPAKGLAYARKLLQFTADPHSRKHPLESYDGLLEELMFRAVPKAIKYLDAAISLSTPIDGQICRQRIVDAIYGLPMEVILQWAQLLPFALSVPDTTVRLQFIAAWPGWHDRFGPLMVDFLRLLEPVMAHLDAPMLQRLLQLMQRPVPDCKEARRALPREGSEVPALPSAFDLHGLTDEEVNDALDACGDEVPVDMAPTINPLTDRENVMRSRRHMAARSAVRLLQRTVGSTPDDQAVFAVLHLALSPSSKPPIAQGWLAHPEAMDLALRAWGGRYELEDYCRPITANAWLDYLGDSAMPTYSFVNLIYSAIQQYRAQDKTWPESAKERSLMRAAFVRELADCMALTKKFVVRHRMADAPKPIPSYFDYYRVCPVGITQQLLDAVSGYYPFSLDVFTPEVFLTSIAEKAFGALGENDAPDVEQVASFADYALTTGRQIFAPSPGTSAALDNEFLVFKQLLTNYLAYDHDFVLVDPAT